mgnify:CR=1 FL=1
MSGTLLSIMISIGSAAVGAIISYFLLRFRLRTSEAQSAINDHIKDIEKFVSLSQAYWLKSSSETNAESERAAFVKSALHRLTISYPIISVHCKGESEKYKKLMLEMFELATGGEFETFKRSIDSERALSTAEKSNEIVMQLRRIRRMSMSVRYNLFGKTK